MPKSFILLTNEDVSKLSEGEQVTLCVRDSQGGYRIVYLMTEDAYYAQEEQND